MGAFSGSGLSLGTLWVNIAASVDDALAEFTKFSKDATALAQTAGASITDSLDVTIAAPDLSPLSAAMATAGESAKQAGEQLNLFAADADGISFANADGQLNMFTDELGAFASGTKDAEAGASGLGQAFGQLGQEAASAGEDAHSGGEGFAEFADKIPLIGGLLAALAGGALLDIGKELLDIGEKAIQVAEIFDNASIQMERATGAEGQALAGLDESFKTLFANSSASAEGIATALTQITVRTGATGAALEELTKSAIDFAKITGTDLATSVQLNEKLFARWSIATADQAGKLDVLYEAARRSAGTVASLAQSLTTLSPVLRSFGMDFTEAAALVGSFEKAGLDATDMTMGLKSILAKFVEAGKDPKQALADLIQELQDTESREQALKAGLDAGLTGRSLPAFVDAVKNGAFQLGVMKTALDNAGGSVAAMAAKTDTLSESWSKLGHGVLVSLDPLTKAFAEALANLNQFLDALSRGKDLIAEAQKNAQKITPPAITKTGTSDALKDPTLIQSPALQGINALNDAIEKNAKAGAALANTTLPGIANALQKIVPPAKQGADGLRDHAAAATAAASATGLLSQASEVWFAIASKLTALHKQYIGTLADTALGLKQVEDVTKILAPSADGLGTALGTVTSGLAPIPALTADVAQVIAQLGNEAGNAVTPVITLQNQLHILGLKSKEEYQGIADTAAAAYRAILNDQDASETEILQAEEVMLETRIAAWIYAGNAIDQTDKDTLAKVKARLAELEGSIKTSGQRQLTIWQDTMKKAGRIIESAAGTFASDIFKRLFEGSDTNKQLDQQAADLQKSLADRQTALDKFEADNNQKQADATQQYEQSLADEDAAYAKSLADKQAAFDKDAADIAGKQAKLDANYQADLAKTTKDYQDSLASKQQDYDKFVQDATAAEAGKEKDLADRLASEQKDLQESLAKETLDYNRYAGDVTAKIAEIQKSHSESLASELADLDQSLADRRQEYSDYVQDANRSLARIGEDHAQNIADQTSTTQDNIAAQTKDYKRYAQDTQAQLAQIRKKHGGVYSQEEADLQKSFDRRTEDYNSSIDDQNKKLADFVTAEKRKQQQEEQDLQDSLARKARDQAEYETQIQTKRAETIGKNAEDQASEIAAQQQALARKTQDFDAYQLEIAGKLTAAEQQYEQGLADNRAALQQELTDKKTDLDQYNTDAAGKYDADVAKLNANYAEDRGNLDQNLADKLADLEQFNTDAKTKHDGNVANAKAAYQQTTTDLETELTNQLADYTQFVTDTKTKLEEIRQAHKTLWQDIGGFGVSAIESIGQALVSLAASEAVKELGKLVFGTATAAAGGAAQGSGSAAGAAGQVAGQVASGLAGLVTAISGVVTSISSVIQNFQLAAVNKSLDVIVNHTLRIFNELYYFRIDAWSRWSSFQYIKDDIIRDLNAIMDDSNLSILKFDDMITKLTSISDSSAHASAMLDRIAGAPDQYGSASLLDQLLTKITSLSGSLDGAGLSSSSMSMNLYGTDPTLVASRIAQQLRLQGGFS